MDVRDLAPALLAMGELFQQTNLVLNASRANVSVNVKAEFRRGSFEVSLDVVQLRSALELAKTFLLGDDLKAADILVKLLFGGTGLYALIKWLRGRKPTATQPLPNGAMRIEINQTHIEVHGDVAKLYNDARVRELASGPLVPLEREGVDVFQVSEPGAAAPLETVRKEDLDAFRAPVSPETLIADDPPRTVAVEVITLSFEDRYKWRFSDGGSVFTADIEDEGFFERLQRREISFSKGDVLRVQLKTRTWRTEKGLRSEYKVVSVLDVIPAPQQLPLLPAPPDPTDDPIGDRFRNIEPY